MKVWFVVTVALAALLSGFFGVLLYEHGGCDAVTLVVIVLGGLGGGFTLALTGGESYGIKIPGKAGVNGTKFDPGFLGDTFVGLMAGFLGIGLSSETLKRPIFAVGDGVRWPDLWFSDFSIAFVSGFLGLQLVKAASRKYLDQAEIKERLEDSDEVNNFLLGQEALRDKFYDQAEHYFSVAIEIDGKNASRSLIGLARAQRYLSRLGDALATLELAIRSATSEDDKARAAVAYWNRACYRTICEDFVSEQNLELILSDLRAALDRQPAYKLDLLNDADLNNLHGNPRFQQLVE